MSNHIPENSTPSRDQFLKAAVHHSWTSSWNQSGKT